MAKCGAKPKEPTRRELRQLWREAAKNETPQGQSNFQQQLQPLFTPNPMVTSRRLLPRARKAGGRRKPIQVPDLLSPTKTKKIKGDIQKARKSNSGDLSLSPRKSSSSDVLSLLEEFQNRFKSNATQIQTVSHKIKVKATKLPLTPLDGSPTPDGTSKLSLTDLISRPVHNSMLTSSSSIFSDSSDDQFVHCENLFVDKTGANLTSRPTSEEAPFHSPPLRTATDLSFDRRPYSLSSVPAEAFSPQITPVTSHSVSTVCNPVKTLLSVETTAPSVDFRNNLPLLVSHTAAPRCAKAGSMQESVAERNITAHGRMMTPTVRNIGALSPTFRFPSKEVRNILGDDISQNKRIPSRSSKPTNNLQVRKRWTLSNVSFYDTTGNRDGNFGGVVMPKKAASNIQIGKTPTSLKIPSAGTPEGGNATSSQTQSRLMPYHGANYAYASRYCASNLRPSSPQSASLLGPNGRFPTSHGEADDSSILGDQSTSEQSTIAAGLSSNSDAIESLALRAGVKHVTSPGSFMSLTTVSEHFRPTGTIVPRTSLLPFSAPSKTINTSTGSVESSGGIDNYPGRRSASNTQDSTIPLIAAQETPTPPVISPMKPEVPTGFQRSTRRATLLRALNIEWLAREETDSLDIESGGDLLPVTDLDEVQTSASPLNSGMQVQDKHSAVARKVNSVFERLKYLLSPWRVVSAVYRRS